MVNMLMCRGLSYLLVLIAAVACTDAGLYAAGAGGPSGPDRAELKGTVCVPLAAGEAFPVKVLFALQGGAGVDRTVVGNIASAVSDGHPQFASELHLVRGGRLPRHRHRAPGQLRARRAHRPGHRPLQRVPGGRARSRSARR